MPKKHKYTTIFAAKNFKVYNPTEEDKFLAKANFDNLKNFLPKIDFERNYDLLGISFGGFISSYSNLNGQIIAGQAAKDIAPLFVSKFVDFEHSRDRILGFITNYGFADVATEEPLSEEEVDRRIAIEEPFLICFGGVIWKTVDSEFAEILETRNDITNDLIPIKCSWECAFDLFNIVEGSKNLSEATIITDETEIEEIFGNLAHFGGSGKNPKTGKDIYLNILGSALPLGFGLTRNPAQQLLQPALVISDIDNTKLQNEQESIFDESLIVAKEKNNEKIEENNELLENNSSPQNNDSVNASTLNISSSETKRKQTYMKLTKIDQLTDSALTTGEVTASLITEFFTAEIDKAGKEFAAKKVEAETALANETAAKEAAVAELAELKAKAEKAETELAEIKAQVDAREKAETFQTRLAGIANEYNLDDEENQVIAEQIKDLDQAGFDKWIKSFAVLAKMKSKTFKPNDKKDNDEDDKATAAEKEAKAKLALAALQQDNSQVIPPNTGGQVETLAGRWAKAFSKDSISIK